MLARVHVQKEISQGTFEARTPALVNREASSGNFRSRGEIQNSRALTNLPVGLRRKIKSGRGSPAPHLDVFRRAVTDGDTEVWHIRNRQKEGALS